jgi:hypothetical protein
MYEKLSFQGGDYGVLGCGAVFFLGGTRCSRDHGKKV